MLLRRAALLIGTLLIVAPLPPAARAKAGTQELAIAAASNLTQVFELVGTAFQTATGIHPVFSFGSTARLTHQIENGAPWDVFVAADTEHVAQLENKGLLARDSNAVYATGILALWIPSRASSVNRVEDLIGPSVRVIAMATPELAPYGLAARDTLQSLGIWSKVQSRVVYAENISMAKQYGATGNADAVFTAYALVKSEKGGRAIEVPESLHKPIRQALGIIASSKNQALARQFTDFLLTGKGRQILLQNGYR